MPNDKAIGIIGAMDVEVNTLKNVIDGLVTENVSGIEFYSGKINGTKTVVAECGIGKVNAAICAEIMAVKYNVSAIINTGIGGGIGEGLQVGDLVIASGLVQHDFDVSPFGYAKGYMFRGSKDKPTVYETDAKLNGLIKRAAQGHIDTEKLKSGIIATGDMFVADRDKKTEIRNTFNALVAEMEGGAVAQTAAASGIPFAVVRAISDLADGEGCETYEVFEEETARLSAKIIESFLGLMSTKDNM